MIQTQNLGKQFENFVAVDGIDLNIGVGEVLGLLGPNGAGKTTTVRMLTSVLKPSKGWAHVAGYDVVKQAKEVRASVGVLTENHGLYNRMPAGDYLDFFGQLYRLDKSERQKRTSELLDHFGLLAVSRKPLGEFSKGMRQKLALARALLHNPPVLLLDEPTSAMDPESARLVRDAIRDLRSEERTIIICTHNLAEAEELSDKIAIIRRGKIIAQGTPKALKSSLLGPEEYTLQFAEELNGHHLTLPDGATIVSNGSDWIRYQVKDPKQVNPEVLKHFMELGKPIVSLQKVHRSLEQVYLQAINAPDKIEVFHD